MLKRLIALLLLIPSLCLAMPGMDYLAGAKYGEVIARNHPPGWAAGFFLDTFGDAIPSIERLLATGKCPRVRVHIIWEDNHTYSPAKHDRIIARGVQRLNRLKARFPGVDIQVSPFCEHNIRGAALQRIMASMQATAKGLTIVNTPWQGDLYPGIINETHGKHAALKPPYNFSFDGTEVVNSDVEAFRSRHSGADTFFYWSTRYNLKWSENDTTPRPDRKGYPTREYIESIAWLDTGKGKTELPKGYIVKSHSEHHGAGETKGDKLLIIAPVKANQISLKGISGIQADELQYYGPFQGGGYRYYSRSWGYQIARKARAAQGSPILNLWAKGENVGRINAGFRDGNFR